MKKRVANLLFLLSILIGAGMGFVRSNIFLKHYDGFTGVVLNTASLSLTLLTAFLVIFAIAVFIICRRFFSFCQISRKLSLIDKILILVGSVSIGISAYLAFTMQGGFFEKTFAVSAVVAIIYFALVVMNAKGTMVDLLSCASVLPAALILLSIYKTNIRFPNIVANTIIQNSMSTSLDNYRSVIINHTGNQDHQQNEYYFIAHFSLLRALFFLPIILFIQINLYCRSKNLVL